MRFILNVIEKMQRHPKRVVFPEGEEPRILQAARQFATLRMGAPILLGDPEKIQAVAADLKISLTDIRIINPTASEDLENFTQRFYRVQSVKGLRQTEAREAMSQPNFYGAMMLAMHQADGMVSGATHITGSVLRPLTQIVRLAPGIGAVSSCMVMEVEDMNIGEKGVLFMADCDVIPDPTVDQLADIAVSTARLARHMLGVRSRVAMLAFSTKGSAAAHPSIGKIQAATAQARRKAAQLNIEADFDGELQVDAALIPEIAARKLHDNSPVAGRANVLIFPDLNSGNIASKLLSVVSRTSSYGQILLGLNRPAADVSRGSSAHDILGVAAIIGVQATDYLKLYPEVDKELPGEG
jgi:phosphate acetyltransferase